MAWTTPKTWAVEPLVATDLNTHVRDNLNHLYDRLGNGVAWVGDEGTDYTTTSATFEDVDDTEGKGKHTITTNGGDVLVGFAALVENSSGATRYVAIDLAVDGVRVGGDDGIVRSINSADAISHLSFTHLVTDLSAGEHVFKIQWRRNNNGTVTMFAGAGTSEKDTHPIFWVQET